MHSGLDLEDLTLCVHEYQREQTGHWSRYNDTVRCRRDHALPLVLLWGLSRDHQPWFISVIDCEQSTASEQCPQLVTIMLLNVKHNSVKLTMECTRMWLFSFTWDEMEHVPVRISATRSMSKFVTKRHVKMNMGLMDFICKLKITVKIATAFSLN